MNSTQINIPSFQGTHTTGLVFALIEGLKTGESLNLVCDYPTSELENLLKDADLPSIRWDTKQCDPQRWILHIEKSRQTSEDSIGCCGLCGENKKTGNGDLEMLSKSQAKAFFLIGTGVFSAIFIGLTVDTFQRIPKQTNAAEMNASVVRGKHLFDKSNCMGCHTILGEGAYYAPELTKVYDRRGPAFIKAMLKDPQAMYPGQRKMTNYKFSDPEMEDLTAFLQWVGTMDLNGFPPKPDILSNATVARPNADGAANSQPKVFSQMCIPCHSLGGQGGSIGPALDGVGSRLEMSYIANWLADPTLVKPGTQMPKLPLSTEEIDALAKYLSSLKGGAQ